MKIIGEAIFSDEEKRISPDTTYLVRTFGAYSNLPSVNFRYAGNIRRYYEHREDERKLITMFDKCPGAANIRTPTIKIKKCPECGEEVEIFSNEMQVKCSNCGFTVYNDLQSCVQWCKYAKECVGEELYKKLKKRKK